MASYGEVQKQLVQMAIKNKIPIHGEFELTSNCNLNCEMCYVRDNTTKELDTETWKKIFKASVDEGMLFALLTGGEILKRKDFAELYSYLYDLGVKITLYTNGTLINQEIIDVLTKRPPQMVFITLYGIDNKTYEEVARVKHGFDLVNQGIDLLVNNKINVLLRTSPIKKLYPHVDAIIDYAKSKNLTMVYYLYIGPKRNGCNVDLEYRLDPLELAIYESKFRKAFGYQSNETFRNSDSGAKCAALRSAFFVNWEGVMQPCALMDKPSRSLLGSDFKEVWLDLNQRMQELPLCDACASCELRAECIQCDARRTLEGSITKCGKYLRDFAQIRAEVRNGQVSNRRD